MLLGYARVSTDQQDHALQLDALRAAGCEKVFVETGSGTRADRPELAKALEQVRQDDVLVVWRLDRLALAVREISLSKGRRRQRAGEHGNPPQLSVPSDRCWQTLTHCGPQSPSRSGRVSYKILGD